MEESSLFFDPFPTGGAMTDNDLLLTLLFSSWLVGPWQADSAVVLPEQCEN